MLIGSFHSIILKLRVHLAQSCSKWGPRTKVGSPKGSIWVADGSTGKNELSIIKNVFLRGKNIFKYVDTLFINAFFHNLSKAGTVTLGILGLFCILTVEWVLAFGPWPTLKYYFWLSREKVWPHLPLL